MSLPGKRAQVEQVPALLREAAERGPGASGCSQALADPADPSDLTPAFPKGDKPGGEGWDLLPIPNHPKAPIGARCGAGKSHRPPLADGTAGIWCPPLGVAAAGSVGDQGPQRGPSGRSCRAGGTTRVPFMDEVAMGDGRGLHPDRDPREPFQGPSVTPLGQEPRGPGRGRVPAGPARRWWERGETQTFRREEPAESRTLPRRQH